MSYCAVLAHISVAAKRKGDMIFYDKTLSLCTRKVDPYVDAVLDICNLSVSRFM